MQLDIELSLSYDTACTTLAFSMLGQQWRALPSTVSRLCRTTGRNEHDYLVENNTLYIELYILRQYYHNKVLGVPYQLHNCLHLDNGEKHHILVAMFECYHWHNT